MKKYYQVGTTLVFLTLMNVVIAEEPMKTENQSEIIQKQIQDANKHWRLFLSEVPLRQADLSLVTQTPNTNVETYPEISGSAK